MNDEFPCNNCLVNPICQIYCFKVFEYINLISDNINHLSYKEKFLYELNTPTLIKTLIKDHHKYGKKLCYPSNAEVERSDMIWPSGSIPVALPS